MNQLSELIQRSILEDEDVITFKKNANNIGSFGYKGLNIEVFSCPIHNNEFLVCASGLGHTLNMSYWIAPEWQRDMSAKKLITLAYDDFKDFVIYEREEEHLVMH